MFYKMQNITFLLLLLIIMSGCALIDNLETISDHVDDTTNPNSQPCTSFGQYRTNNFDIENPELREQKKLVVDTALDALNLWGYAQNENTDSKEKLLQMYDKYLLKAIELTKKYKYSAAICNSKKEETSINEALKALEKAIAYHKSNNHTKAIRQLEYAFLLLTNNEQALWLWQNDDHLVFPDYLKWDDSTMNNSRNIVTNPDSLAFSGGGVKGTAYAGIIKYLEETGKLKNVKRFVGTSAGAIMCTFISIGTYYNENKSSENKKFWEIIYKITMENDFINFIDNPKLKKAIEEDSFTPFTKNIVHSVASISKTLDNQYALCNGDKLIAFLKNSLNKFGIDENITLKELNELTGKHLILVACSLSYRKAAYFDYKSAPDLKVVDAVRASMAIPYIFKPIKYNNDFFIDGGAVNNFPINYFDESINDKKTKPKTLGFILYTKKEILRPEWRMIKNPADYTYAVSDLVMVNTGSALFKKNVDRTVFIDCGKIDVMSFNITETEKKKIIQAGYDSIEKYFNPNYKTSDDSILEKKKSNIILETEKKNKAGLSWYILYPELPFILPGIKNVYGLCLGIPFSLTKKIYGIELSLFFNNTKKVAGLSTALANNVNCSTNGILLSLINNFNCNYSSHALLLGLLNNTNNMSTCNISQIAAINNINNIVEMNALQFGLINTVNSKFDQFNGFQAGLFNKTNNMNGFQIGLFNNAKAFKGLQFGLINKIENAWIPYFPLFNFSF